MTQAFLPRLRTMQAFIVLASLAAFASAAAGQAITGRITDAAALAPISGARIHVVGTTSGTQSRSDGSYRITIVPGTYVLRVSSIGYVPRTDTVIVGATGASRDFALQKGGVQLDAAVVIGSRSTDRTVLNAPVPVDVLTTAEIQQTGQVETSQIIQMLAPSFNFPRATIGDGTDHIRPSTLRGLGPDQVLVLINGKRRHTSSLVNVNGTVGRGSTGVDLNAIPASAIERIEILRDGAAAQYGSDAIAGVINVILKTDASTDLSAMVGTTKEGDGDVSEIDANIGYIGDNNAYLHVTGEYRNRGSTNRSLPDTRTQYFAGDPRNTNPALNNRINHRQGDAHTNDVGFFANAALPQWENGVQAYAFGGFTHREGQAAGFWRRALDDRTVRAIYPDGFLPLINSDINDLSANVGIKGALNGWNWDLSGVYGRNSFAFRVSNSANVTLGAASPTEFDAGVLKFGQGTLNLDLVRPFDIGFATPLSFAMGAEARRDTYGIEAGEPDSYRDGGVKILDGPNAGKQGAVGAQVFPGFQPRDAGDHSRTNVAGYIDLETNLMPALLVGAAARTEHYSDFGSTTTGKINARFEAAPGYAIRGAVQTGFRAPSLGQEYFSSTATNFIGGVPFDIRTFPVESELAKVLGAQPLKPEKSINYSLGLAMSPLSNLSLTADYYHIRIDDRIVLSGNFISASVRQLFADKGFSGVGGGRYFTNAIDTKTNGIDIVGRYALDLGSAGISRLTAGFNHNKSEVTRVSNTPPQLAGQQEVLFDRVERARIEVGQPRNNLNLTLDHTYGKFSGAVHANRFGEVAIKGSTPAFDQSYSAKWITDVNASFSPIPRFKFTVGANNLFDIYPDKNIPGNDNAGIFPYNGISPFGFNGRFAYVRARWER